MRPPAPILKLTTDCQECMDMMRWPECRLVGWKKRKIWGVVRKISGVISVIQSEILGIKQVWVKMQGVSYYLCDFDEFHSHFEVQKICINTK